MRRVFSSNALTTGRGRGRELHHSGICGGEDGDRGKRLDCGNWETGVIVIVILSEARLRIIVRLGWDGLISIKN